jgi:hypothetical protein
VVERFSVRREIFPERCDEQIATGLFERVALLTNEWARNRRPDTTTMQLPMNASFRRAS